MHRRHAPYAFGNPSSMRRISRAINPKGPSMPDKIRLPSFRLDDRVAMVTGAGAGIGAGIATGLAEAGADLVLVGRTAGPLEATARQVESFGFKANVLVCDLTDRTELRRQI